MRKIALSIGALGALLAAVFCTTPGHATGTNQRSWVSNKGSGTACTESAPCATFAQALAATESGGEINCLTPGEYGNGATLIIAQSVTINCQGVLASLTAPSGAPAITISASGITVNLLFFYITGAGVGTEGISITNAAAVNVQDVAISGFTDRGILNESSSAINLLLVDCVIAQNEGTGLGVAAASGSGAYLRNTLVGGNGKWGIAATSGNAVLLQNSVVGSNTSGGVYATGSYIFIDGSWISGNPVGVENAGSASINLNNTDVVGNTIGFSGAWNSYGNNRVGSVSSNGTAPTPVTTE